MRRPLRILLSGLTVLSLVLALASAVVWVRGYWREDVLRWNRPTRAGVRTGFACLFSGGGGVAVFVGSGSPGFTAPWLAEGWHWRVSDRPPVRYAGGANAARRGFGYESRRIPEWRYRAVIFPNWLPTALFAAPPLARGALFIRRRRRTREGHCAKCGYDLRATPERCPECGHVPAGVTRAGAA